MGQVYLTTYKDLIDHLVDYAGADSSKETERVARRAVQAAYSEMGNNHRWSYYYKRGYLNTSAMQTTGTVAYTAATNQLVLTGATWPSWANLGSILINNLVYDVASVPNSTTLTFTNQSKPTQDMPAGTVYTLYQDTYSLPPDFVSCDELINTNNLILLSYEHPREWLSRQRIVHTPAIPRLYTITGDPHFFGAMAARFFPPPDNAYAITYLYQRRPRTVATWDYHTGRVGTGGTTAVTGTGTGWTSALAGSVIRIGNDPSTQAQPPTGIAGSTPFYLERVITAVSGPTSLTVDAVIPDTLSSVMHEISDPVDYEDGAMSTYFLRECERQFRIMRRIKTMPEEMKAYEDSKIDAWEADARSFAVRAAGQRGAGGIRLAYMPRGPDVS